MTIIEYLKRNSFTNKYDYFDLKFINHSMLVNFEKYGPRGLQMKNESTRAMIFGSLVDCLLFTPYNFENEFFICEDNKILTEKQKEIYTLFARELPDIFYKNFWEDYDEEKIIQLCRNNNIYSSYKDTTVLVKVKELLPIFKLYYHSLGKSIITPTEYTQASTIVEKLKNNPLTKKLFSDNFLRFYQVMIINDKTLSKVLFDMILVDQKNKKIIPMDLKCTQGYENEFLENSFYKFRYYRQAEMYMDALHDLLENCEDRNEWTIEDFKFLVVSAQDGVPMIYNFPVKYDDDKKLIINRKGTTVDNYNTIISKISWHRSNNEYTYPQEIVEEIYANERNNNIIYLNIL